MKNFIRAIIVLAIIYVLVSGASMQFNPAKWCLEMVGYGLILCGVVIAAVIATKNLG